MRKTIYICMLILIASFSAHIAYSEAQVKIDVLYMNHGPLLSTLNKMKSLFDTYGSKITVSWHDYESDEAFKDKKGIKGHIPLVIWINNSEIYKYGDTQIKFIGFPSGSGPGFAQGKWTLNDLKAAIDKATKNKKNK